MKNLAEQIKEVFNNWRYGLSSYSVGGCETCGYGGSETYEMSDEDIEKLEADIDELCKHFENKIE